MVYYICYYDVMADGKFCRNISPAAVRKIDYIIKKIEQTGESVTVISPAVITEKQKDFKRKVSYGNTTVQYFPGINATNKIARVLAPRLGPIWVFLYCLLHVSGRDTVVYYHAPTLDNAVAAAYDIKKFNLISEIEEIYALVWKQKKKEIRAEQNFLCKCTKKAIVVSETLKTYLKRPDAIVSYGSYEICERGKKQRADDGTVSLVFSGAIERVKGGAVTALQLMEHLPPNYRLIMSGKCSASVLPELKEKIEKINAAAGTERVKYAGLLPQKEFEELLLSSDIALNLQQEGEFSAFLFPSKLLTYLSYNLPIVTTPGESIVKSSFADLLYVTDGYDMENIVQTVQSVDIEHHGDYRIRLAEMDAVFSEKLDKMLHGEE